MSFVLVCQAGFEMTFPFVSFALPNLDSEAAIDKEPGHKERSQVSVALLSNCITDFLP